MKNEEWLREPKAEPSSSYAEVKPATLHSSFHIHFFIIVYCILFYCFFMEETNKAMISLQSLAILSN